MTEQEIEQAVTFEWEPAYGFAARPRDVVVLAEALEQVRRERCAYGPRARTCDCKYGLTVAGQRTLEVTGCAELRSVIYQLLHGTLAGSALPEQVVTSAALPFVVVDRTRPMVASAPDRALIDLRTLAGAERVTHAEDCVILGVGGDGFAVCYRVTGWDARARAFIAERTRPSVSGQVPPC